jgi:adenosine deaminase
MNLIKSALFLLAAIGLSNAQADVNTYLQHIKSNPEALYAFFKTMPKGGELHYHLAGGPYPEVMLSLAAQKDYCLNQPSMTVSEASKTCTGEQTNTIRSLSPLYNQIIRSWSLKDFSPGAESAHDHFFNSFMKYMYIVMNHRPQLIANVVERAANQNEHYLEIMDIADNAQSAGFGSLIKDSKTYAQNKEMLLLDKAFQKNINYTIEETERMYALAREELGCKKNPKAKKCQVKIKFLYYVLREQPVDNFFAQALNAFEAVNRSQGALVGVNLVQPEDGVISLRDYEQQMRIYNYLHSQYPKVHIALHAGEITPELVPAHELSYHIHDALFIGKAQRIGHGTDITHEANTKTTLAYMASHQIPVEINLISNALILNVSGLKSPLNYYLKHQVPVVLSTDDEGILRTDLTQQYVTAASEHHLDYATIKHINRNALTYAFIPGKSIWADAAKAQPVTACSDLNAKSCIEFINQNEKAQIQWRLEKDLWAFEKKYSKRSLY